MHGGFDWAPGGDLKYWLFANARIREPVIRTVIERWLLPGCRKDSESFRPSSDYNDRALNDEPSWFKSLCKLTKKNIFSLQTSTVGVEDLSSLSAGQ